MLVIIDKPGQLCNRLWSYAPFIIDAINNNYKLKIIGFYDYCDDFKDLELKNNITFTNNKFLFKLINKGILKNILRKLNILYDKKIKLDDVNIKNKVILIESWSHKKPNVDLYNNDDIRLLFSPKEINKSKVDQIFLKRKKLNHVIIGVHIRRGDYKKYRNGEYYYSDSIFKNFISQLKTKFRSDTKVTFLLCSNEKLNLTEYNNHSVFQIEDANLMEDLYALSKCDYIIGPPSTYSMWASFYGKKPLLFIYKAKTEINLADFSIIISPNRFENGKLLTHNQT